MTFIIEFEQETDGRWIAEIPALPGVMVYGDTREEATEKVEALAREIVESWNPRTLSLHLLEQLAQL